MRCNYNRKCNVIFVEIMYCLISMMIYDDNDSDDDIKTVMTILAIMLMRTCDDKVCVLSYI